MRLTTTIQSTRKCSWKCSDTSQGSWWKLKGKRFQTHGWATWLAGFATQDEIMIGKERKPHGLLTRAWKFNHVTLLIIKSHWHCRQFIKVWSYLFCRDGTSFFLLPVAGPLRTLSGLSWVTVAIFVQHFRNIPETTHATGLWIIFRQEGREHLIMIDW